MKYSFGACIVLLTVFATTAFAERGGVVPGDYDNDGQTDITVARKVGGAWHWYLRLATGAEIGPVPFGLASDDTSDTLLPGDFDGDGDYNLNVVRDTAGFLYWYHLNNDGTTTETIWGLTGDTPLTGFFGGSGENDRVVVRTVGGALIWYIEGIAPNGISWGLEGDVPYVADVTGDGIDELIVVRNEGGQKVWYIRDLSGSFSSRVEWGLEADTVLYPSDFNGDGKADLAVSRGQGGFNVVFIRYTDITDNGSISVSFGLDSDAPYIGRFTRSGLSELAVKRSSNGFSSHFVRFASDGTVVNVIFGLDSDTLVAPEGGALSVATSSTPGCTPSPGTTDTFVDGRLGSLWKPVSEGVANEAPVILLPLDYAGSPITILSADGQVVSGIQRTLNGGHNGNRAHFWLSATAEELEPFAPITVQIINNGLTECRIVPHPSTRYD